MRYVASTRDDAETAIAAPASGNPSAPLRRLRNRNRDLTLVEELLQWKIAAKGGKV
jgi:hypothetical protein